MVCDRFADSTMAYQGYGLELSPAVVADIHDLVIGDFAPDLTIVLDMPVAGALSRLARRGGELDRYEARDPRPFTSGFGTVFGRSPPPRRRAATCSMPTAEPTSWPTPSGGSSMPGWCGHTRPGPRMASSGAGKGRGERAGDAESAPRKAGVLVGQARPERTLRRAWDSGRLAHAWLLHGPRGIGKATLAYRFARFVLAGGAGPGLVEAQDDGATLAVDPDDPVARRVAAGAHADLATVERSWDEKRKRLRNEIVVADVRALSSFFAMTPAEGGWRVAVVDAADEMNRHAANAVLKILEEPPRRGLLLLVSHAPGGCCRRSVRAAAGWPSIPLRRRISRPCWRRARRTSAKGIAGSSQPWPKGVSAAPWGSPSTAGSSWSAS